MSKRTKVNPGKWDTWPIGKDSVVQLGAVDKDALHYYDRQDVYLDGEKVGYLESHMRTERVKIAGTRLGRDLKPTKAWKVNGERFNYRSRTSAITAVLNDWKTGRNNCDTRTSD